MDNRGEDRKDFAEKRSFRKNDGERGERRYERSDNFKPRRFERDGERRDFKKDGFRPHGDKRPRGIGELLDLDNDILHLVIRRAQLLAKMRQNGRLAPETEKTSALPGKARPPAWPATTAFPAIFSSCSRPSSLSPVRKRNRATS